MTFLAATLLVGLLVQASAAGNEPAFKADQLPAKAARAAAFVPAGWLLERQISGDLNGDKRPDPVLILVERPSPTAPELRRERALVVLLSEPTGQFRRVAASGSALYCTGCYESDSGPGGTPQLSISKEGVLAVRHISGSTQTRDLTQRYRYEAAEGRVRLVGESLMLSSRQKLDTTLKRTDFLTGQQQTEHITADPKDPSGARQQVTRKDATVPKTKHYLEDVKVDAVNL